MSYPNEITRCEDTGINTASFDYNTGIKVAAEKKLQQTTDFADVREGTHFIVCCGDVMIKVEETDYPDIKRRDF